MTRSKKKEKVDSKRREFIMQANHEKKLELLYHDLKKFCIHKKVCLH